MAKPVVSFLIGACALLGAASLCMAQGDDAVPRGGGPRKPLPPIVIPDKDYVVRRCLSVVLKEEAEHHRYAVRDLTVLEADTRTE